MIEVGDIVRVKRVKRNCEDVPELVGRRGVVTYKNRNFFRTGVSYRVNFGDTSETGFNEQELAVLLRR